MRLRESGVGVTGEGVLWLRWGVEAVREVETARLRLTLAEACLSAWVAADEERGAERAAARR